MLRIRIATLAWLCWLMLLGSPGRSWSAGQRPDRGPSRPPDIFFVPTWEPIVYEMLKLAAVTRDDVVFDLGSGDGRIVILAAQKYGARGVGIEIDPKLVAISRQIAREAQVADRVTFLGVTRQLVGERWLHAGAFHYCGSLFGPGFREPLCKHRIEPG